MNPHYVIGLFQSLGEAENASHRLVSENVLPGNIALRVLAERGEMPDVMKAEAGKLPDPFSLLMGDLRRDYPDHIADGLTVVIVTAKDEVEAEAVASILWMFVPVRVDIHHPADETRDIRIVAFVAA